MLFAIKLDYVRPFEEIQAHLDAHKAWLIKYAQAGNILAAGPLHGESGGFVLAYAGQPRDIETMIAEDPFHIHGLAKFDVVCCEPAICVAGFPTHWAAGARTI
ncbi:MULTISPECIES: YciI family protein [Burkholderia]|uniref:YCII-related domain-containing protein n=3 Tax=Burkholderia cepacia complex TaxID=87882 RepID=A0ABN5D308_BURCE|nr:MULTISPECIES: YciI family protein [Burkholderia]BEV51081.1 hypothetical protein BconGalA64_35800 [Burkholderia contaminans]ABK10035.1 conserved hypothetical protein [Burkholderia cenocepacia HI2424]AIO22482.1 YCII-related domain protein [Burkholderia cepacia ATCC 25416]ALK23734.1 hypothetical protein APZ15_38100 [Burkholderia cepacia ATCC 25416]ASE92253.1 hypothetical protein CEQ23_00860 [Burkholderia cepacia]